MLNDAATEPEASRLLDFLSEIQERIVFKDSGLLDDWLDEVVQYQTHVSQDVRKWVVGFIEESCKKDPEILTRVITNLRIMMNDQAISVRKRVIQAMTFLYKLCLKWLCTVKFINENMEAVWQGITEMKNSIIAMVHSDNDGNFYIFFIFSKRYIFLKKIKNFKKNQNIHRYSHTCNQIYGNAGCGPNSCRGINRKCQVWKRK